MDFGFLIIIFVIIMVIVSAVSKKKKPSKDNEEGEPVRRPAMSDIQRAFMMMGDVDHDNRQQPEEKRYAPKTYDNVSPEGMRGATEGFMSQQGTRKDGASLSFEGVRKDGIAVSNEGFRGNRSVSTEGTRYKTMAAMSARVKENIDAPMQHRLNEKAEIEDTAALNKAMLETRKAGAARLNLFEGQNDIVKAIIYSEIINRKSKRRA